MSNLPPLPVPWDHCYIWNGPYGARKFTIAPHNGRPCDKAVLIFTEDQLKAFAEEAVRLEREACAVICDELQEHFAAYKDTALLNGDVELSNAASGEPRACEAIAAAIRARSER